MEESVNFNGIATRSVRPDCLFGARDNVILLSPLEFGLDPQLTHASEECCSMDSLI